VLTHPEDVVRIPYMVFGHSDPTHERYTPSELPAAAAPLLLSRVKVQYLVAQTRTLLSTTPSSQTFYTLWGV